MVKRSIEGYYLGYRKMNSIEPSLMGCFRPPFMCGGFWLLKMIALVIGASYLLYQKP